VLSFLKSRLFNRFQKQGGSFFVVRDFVFFFLCFLSLASSAAQPNEQFLSVDAEEELLNEMSEAYIHRFDRMRTLDDENEAKSLFTQIIDTIDSNLRTYYRKKVESSDQWSVLRKIYLDYVKQHAEDAKRKLESDTEWYDPYKVESHRKIFERLTTGGCGTLSTFLCLEKSSSQPVSLEEVDEAYDHSSSRSYKARQAFLESKGLCLVQRNWLPLLGANCDSYDEIKKWMDIGCQIEISMEREDKAHVEFVADVFHSKRLNFCYGISNSWGKASLFRGGNGTFFHEKFSEFNGASIYYGPVCPCSNKSFDHARMKAASSLKAKKLKDAMLVYADLAKYDEYDQEAEAFAYDSLKKNRDWNYLSPIFRNLFSHPKALERGKEKAKTLIGRQKVLLYSILLEFHAVDAEESAVFAWKLAEDFTAENIQASFNVFLELVKIQDDFKELARYEKLARAYLHNPGFQFLCMNILEEISKKNFPLKPLWADLLNIVDQRDFAFHRDALYPLAIQLLRQSGDNVEALELAQRRLGDMSEYSSQYNRKYSVLMFSEFVRQKLRYDECLETVRTSLYDSMDRVRMSAKKLLINLIRANHAASIRYAQEYLKDKSQGLKGSAKDYYDLEIEKLL